MKSQFKYFLIPITILFFHISCQKDDEILESNKADFIKYELIAFLVSRTPGAIGFLLRKLLYPTLFKKVGLNVLWGRNISLRHPNKIEIGDRVAVDDNCLLDARGAAGGGIEIANEVMIARDTIIQVKASGIKINDRTVIGSQCLLTSVGGIGIGKSVLVAGQCYIGGGRYHYEDRKIPMIEQGVFTKGPVIIEDDVWLGAGVVVLDGVRIGKGSVIGSGAVVFKDVPDYSIIVPDRKFVKLSRGES